MPEKVAMRDPVPLASIMHLGTKRLKLGIGWSSRRLRLGVANSGTPSSWIAPAKDNPTERSKPNKKSRR